jgi:hypothetical protein
MFGARKSILPLPLQTAFGSTHKEEFKMTLSSETSTIYDVAKTKLFSDIELGHAKTSLCHFGGAGLLAMMLGAGIGLACFGYSYVADGRAQAQKMADAMVQALERAHLTTTGEIRLADGSTVDLAPGGQVALAPNSMVRVDPSSRVKIDRTVTTDAATTSTEPRTQSSPLVETKVVTHYTTFKSIAYGPGTVVTGWIYDNSNQVRPTSQYCYYDELSDDKTHVRIDLGENGKILGDLKPRVGLDLADAFGNCNWFRST